MITLFEILHSGNFDTRDVCTLNLLTDVIQGTLLQHLVCMTYRLEVTEVISAHSPWSVVTSTLVWLAAQYNTCMNHITV